MEKPLQIPLPGGGCRTSDLVTLPRPWTHLHFLIPAPSTSIAAALPAPALQVDYLLMTHPLLKVVHFDSGISRATGQRVVYSVCRDGRRVLHRVAIPGEWLTARGSLGLLIVYLICVTANSPSARVHMDGPVTLFLMPAGNPIADGIGEGKPENQNNTAPYQHARFLQVRGGLLPRDCNRR